MQIPGLPENGHHRRRGFDERFEIPVVGRRVARVAGAAKRRELGMLQFEFLSAAEERAVFRVRAWPATFDVVQSQIVEFPNDVELVFHRE